MNIQNLLIKFVVLFSLLQGPLAIGAPSAENAFPPGLPPAVEKMLILEATRNDKVEDLSHFASITADNNLPMEYRPEALKPFPIETVYVPLKDLTQFGPQIPSELLVTQNGEKFVRFFVHPQSKNFYQEAFRQYRWTTEYMAAPLSSFRSIIVWRPESPEKPIYLKVTLDAVIGEVHRVLNKRQIERATATSLLLAKIDKKAMEKQGIFFVDEPFSTYKKDFPFGFTYRPLPTWPAGTEAIPMFSLYATKNLESSMLADMIKSSGQPARRYVLEKVIQPLVRQAIYMAFEEGIVSPSHEQNVMAEVKDGQLTGRYYYRDLGGFHVSPELRRAIGKDINFIPRNYNLLEMTIQPSDVVKYIESYLQHSNFFALEAGLKKTYPTVDREFIRSHIKNIMEAEIYLRTGYRASNNAGLARALTNFVANHGGFSCRYVHER